MAIAAILLGVAVPSFVTAVQNNRLSADYQSLASALYFARSEAVKRSYPVAVCSRRNDNTCGGNNHWDNGWLVFTDSGGTGFGGQVGRINGTDEVLRIVDERSDDRGIMVKAKRQGQNKSWKRRYIRYLPSGESSWESATAVLCDEREEEHALALNIIITGDIRKAYPDGNGSIPIGHDGNTVTCP